jgi:copper homeostasis protein
LIRPRGGDFLYSDIEMEIIRRDIEKCKDLMIDGVVIGFLKKDGSIDVNRTQEIVELARPMSVTFHRAFDMCNDPHKALYELLLIGVDRILTSGQQNTAPEGAELIAELVKLAGDRVIIMPGAGLEPENIRAFHRRVKAKEYHSTLWTNMDSRMVYRKQGVYIGGLSQIPEFSINQTDPERVKLFINDLTSIS